MNGINKSTVLTGHGTYHSPRQDNHGPLSCLLGIETSICGVSRNKNKKNCDEISQTSTYRPPQKKIIGYTPVPSIKPHPNPSQHQPPLYPLSKRTMEQLDEFPVRASDSSQHQTPSCPLSKRTMEQLEFPVRASDGGAYEWTYFQAYVRSQLTQSNKAVSVLNNCDRLKWVKPALRKRTNLNNEQCNILLQIRSLSHQLSTPPNHPNNGSVWKCPLTGIPVSQLEYAVQAENGQVYHASALYCNLHQNEIPINGDGSTIRWVMPYNHRNNEPLKVENTSYVVEMNDLLSQLNTASGFGRTRGSAVPFR